MCKMEDSNVSETFGDLSTTRDHPQDEQILIINQSNSIHKSMQDQFASSILRLQADLDTTSQRLGRLETKIEQIQRQQKQSSPNSTANLRGFSKERSQRIISTLVQFGWPVIVYLAFRAIERRTSDKILNQSDH